MEQKYTNNHSDTPNEIVEIEDTPDYRSYWSGFLYAHADLLRQYPGTEQRVRTYDKNLQRQDEIIAEEFKTTGRCYATEAVEWYFNLGSINELAGAQDRLLQAGMIMERRVEAENTDCSDRDKLITGCLFHEASNLIGHPDNDRWMQRALEHYDTILTDTSIPELNTNHQLALRYSYDALFQQLFDRSHQLRARRIYDFSKLEDQYSNLQQAYIDDFNRLCEFALKNEGRSEEPALSNFKGSAFEWFSVLAYRHAMWRKGKLGSTTVRSAFPREDNPVALAKSKTTKKTHSKPKTKSPRQGVDVVINKYHKGYMQERERVQLKAGKGGGNCYLPGVITAINAYSGKNSRIFIEVLQNSAQLMQKQYQGEYLRPHEHETIQEALRFVRPSLIERAA